MINNTPHPGRDIYGNRRSVCDQRVSRTAAFSEVVRDHMGPAPPSVPLGSPCHEAVLIMRQRSADSVLVVNPDNRIKGIVTEHDVARKMAYQLAGSTSVNEVMSSPVHTIREDDYLYHAIAAMRRRDLMHMPAIDQQGRVVGLLHLHTALAAVFCRLIEQIEELTHEESLDGLKQVKKAQVEVAEALFDERVPAPEIQTLLTQINNDIYRRILQILLKRMEEQGWGAPPASFCTIVMGSGGRGESFLYPDQDNGFVIQDYPDSRHTSVDTFFIELASRMTRALGNIGITECRGFVMATNPLWRKTLTQWQNQIRYWIRKASQKTLRLTDIFFDFDAVYGEFELAKRLREDVTQMLKGQVGFLREMHRVQDNHGVALGLFGRLAPDHTPGPHKGKLNLKYHGLLPLAEAIRLLALREGIAHTSTLRRMGVLQELGVLDRNEQDYLSGTFYLITRLVLRQQIRDYKANRPVSAYLSPDVLSTREADMLKDGLHAIDALKDRVRTEFTGSIF
jgi:CBS domain-containing protein